LVLLAFLNTLECKSSSKLAIQVKLIAFSLETNLSQDFAFESGDVRQIRAAKGVTLEALARHCALSIRQLRQIEEGGHDAFYSPSIKQLAQRKVLVALHDADALQAMQRLPHEVLRPMLRPVMQRSFVLETFCAQRASRGH
jgi:DNA-binding transcriptional regulator YiaG